MRAEKCWRSVSRHFRSLHLEAKTLENTFLGEGFGAGDLPTSSVCCRGCPARAFFSLKKMTRPPPLFWRGISEPQKTYKNINKHKKTSKLPQQLPQTMYWLLDLAYCTSPPALGLYLPPPTSLSPPSWLILTPPPPHPTPLRIEIPTPASGMTQKWES